MPRYTAVLDACVLVPTALADTPRDLATLLGRAGAPGFADEVLRLMANPLDGT